MKKYYWISIYIVLTFVIVFTIVGAAIVYLYPIKFKNQILTYSKEFDLEPSLIASIINVESGFNANSVSGAGAMGLMQLMPSTAIEIADKLNVSDFKIKDLLNPDINIRFGCYYVDYLSKIYNNNLVNVLAGYNAGLNNVNVWLINNKYSEDGIEITKTPFKETNDFIKKVQNNHKIYSKMFKN